MPQNLKSLVTQSLYPKITNVTTGTATAVVPAGGETVTVTGSGFLANAVVWVNNASVSTTFVDSTSLTFTSTAQSAGFYQLSVYNSDGSVAFKPGGLIYYAAPVWTTSSGALTNAALNESYTTTLVATGGTLTYSIASGSLPTGMTLNSTTGVISGTSNVENTFNFTIAATNQYNQSTTRSFNITVVGNRVFTISPSVSGKSTWTFEVDGALNLSTSGEWTFTPNTSFTVSAKMWGGGGGTISHINGNMGNGGGGGYASGNITLTGGTTYKIRVGGGGGAGSASSGVGGYNGGGNGANSGTLGGGGGGASGFYASDATIQNNVILLAGGGGGGGYNTQGSQGSGGGGGGSSGAAGSGGAYPAANGSGGGQVSAGGGGATNGNNGWSPTGNGGNGSALTGGTGGPRGSSGAGGGGGGGGYFGGGGGAGQNSIDTGGGGGGGGSGYTHPSLVTNGVLTAGSGTTPGNSGDGVRGSSGNGGSNNVAANAGRVYLS
jgi:hypothetical protein